MKGPTAWGCPLDGPAWQGARAAAPASVGRGVRHSRATDPKALSSESALDVEGRPIRRSGRTSPAAPPSPNRKAKNRHHWSTVGTRTTDSSIRLNRWIIWWHKCVAVSGDDTRTWILFESFRGVCFLGLLALAVVSFSGS